MIVTLFFASAALWMASSADASNASMRRQLRQRTLQDSDSVEQQEALVGQDLSQAFRNAIQEDAMKEHLQAFQAAADSSGGIRAAGSPGWVKSLQYVAAKLTEAGYHVQYHDFEAPYYEELTPPQLTVVSSPVEITNTAPANNETTFYTFKGSASGVVEANLSAAIMESGCDPSDFEDFAAGDIALIQGGGNCSYYDKVEQAVQANASAILFINEGGEGMEDAVINRFRRNLPVPILFGSTALGASLVEALEQGPVVLRMAITTIGENRINKNILAETTHGDPTKTIVVGGHLDSVFEGPGISDNGSGSAGVLELALQLKRNGLDNAQSLQNKVRFAWWGAEDIGVIGSHAYVDDLTQDEIANMAMYINMDMIGSPNFVRFILDGDGSVSSAEPHPQPGSPMAHMEHTLHDYFDEAGLPLEEEPFSNSYGFTDHTPFYDAGVPVTDIHTGIGGIPKSEEQAALFGGQAGEDWDPCYHKDCDTIDNVNTQVMEEMTRAAAHAIAMYASQSGELFVFEKDNDQDQGGTVVINKQWEETWP